jgi:hypothetical protein
MYRPHDKVYHSLTATLLDESILVRLPRVVRARVGLPRLHDLLALSQGYATDVVAVLEGFAMPRAASPSLCKG